MSREVSVHFQRSNHQFRVPTYPSECGHCHKDIDPVFISGAFIRGDGKTLNLELVFQCTNVKCNRLIIGYYERQTPQDVFELAKIAPVTPIGKEFSDEIKEVSQNFINIYNQAFQAEQNNLELIAGIGYRKAIEFLIKDYLVFLEEEDAERILNMPLNQCINKLDNQNIKEISRRATWIGNDEAHYTRKWEDKDVKDLKKLIDVTVYFISMDIAGKKYLSEMS
ncbi:hypothetical protein VKA52_12655 [Halobacillus sp. HZG1]|uniref:hypothetical protein n=1 Tax=Halobacillus sp. HZG1 TaxID=3111769 RepID=UPI002DB77159|nr:hypothetical protein [Halobacillus sp. HZG1]MEC3884576.1 hypothetical protein [Halobacillus sp. HZG1]